MADKPYVLVPLAGEHERVAAHEAGHATVGLSLGTKVDCIERLGDDDIPDVLQAKSFEAGLAVKFTSTVSKLEPRLQFLIAMGGMAGETVVYGKYIADAAASDLDNLKPNILSETEIAGLVKIGLNILNGNEDFFRYLREHLTKRLDSSDRILVVGASANARFNKVGKKIDVIADLDKLLPL